MNQKLSTKLGQFITFEGGEGCGKSTQMALLANRLRSKGIDVLETREPGGSEKAEDIRQYILSSKAQELGIKAEAVLFAAARLDHLEQTIRPALKENKWVLCDRFMDSTRIYQGMYLDTKFIDFLEKITLQDTYPNITILLDIPANEGLERTSKRDKEVKKDRYEKESIELHEHRRQNFLKLAEANSERFLIFDATHYTKTLEKQIWERFQDLFDFEN